MECPLCESNQFKQCGKIANGDFQYRCEICNNIFTVSQYKSSSSLDINFVKSANNRLLNRLLNRKLILFQYQFSNSISRFYNLFNEQDLSDKLNQKINQKINQKANQKVNQKANQIFREPFEPSDRLSIHAPHPIFSAMRNKFLHGFILIGICAAIAFGASYSVSGNFDERYFAMFYTQANAFLQGRIDVGGDWTHDMIQFDGKIFLGIAPLNGFLMVPFVYLFKEKFTETWFAYILYTLLLIVQFIYVEKFAAHRNIWQRSLLFIFLALGTTILPCAIISTSWFNAVLGSCLFHALAWLILYEAKNLKQDLLAIALLAIAAAGRYHLALLLPVFIAKAWLSRHRKNHKALVVLCIPAVMYIAFVAWWNWVRFGYPFSVGYDRITGAAFFEPNIQKYGMHSLAYVLPNIYHGIIGIPRLISQFPFFQVDDLGSGTLAVSPLFIYIFTDKNRGNNLGRNLAWVCIGIIAIPVFTYVSTGWRQFGYRYFLDYFPYVSFLLLKTKFNVLRPLPIFCIAISMWFNILGPIMFLKPEKFGM